MKKHVLNSALMIILAAVLVSCGASDDQAPEASGVTSAEDTASPETSAALNDRDELPEFNFEGYNFRFITRAPAYADRKFTVEEENGETLNDAVFRRNQNITERFNVTFSEITHTGREDAHTALMAGEDAYDLVTTNTAVIYNYAQEGLLIDSNTLKYVDKSKVYWDKELNDSFTIGNTAYAFTGAHSLSAYDSVHILMFNKDMVSNFSLESPYSLVNDGKWTLDKFGEMTLAVTHDVNGDSVMGAEDSYGYLSMPKNVLPSMWIGSEILTIEKDSDDLPVYKLQSNEKFADLFEKAYALTYDSGAWYVNKVRNNGDLTLNNMFEEDRGLLLDTEVIHISSLRDMDTDFGMIPYPKYDEAQDNYRTRIEGISANSVPVTAKDTDRTSVILEALACESYALVRPAYYEIILKTKYTRDEESVDMLDLIFEGRVLDLGDGVWFEALRDGLFETMFMNNDRALASGLASAESKVNETLNNVIENIIK